MLVEVSSIGVQPVVGSASDLLVSKTSPVTLSLGLGERERIDGASLVIRRTDGGSGLATPSIVIDTEPGCGGAGARQITAGWGEVRELYGLSLGLVGLPERPRVRVWVASGRGGWQRPPGSVAAIRDGSQLLVTLYETIADRVRVELLDAQDRPVAMKLDDDALHLDLGNEPRDLSLALHGQRPLWRWSGPIPEEGLAVGDLAARLEHELGTQGCRQPLVLELRAEVAGDLELQWAFSTARAKGLSAAG
ncbi:MAG: hypothetical protein AAGF11_20275 [Myxococcota bacterium]